MRYTACAYSYYSIYNLNAKLYLNEIKSFISTLKFLWVDYSHAHIHSDSCSVSGPIKNRRLACNKMKPLKENENRLYNHYFHCYALNGMWYKLSFNVDSKRRNILFIHCLYEKKSSKHVHFPIQGVQKALSRLSSFFKCSDLQLGLAASSRLNQRKCIKTSKVRREGTCGHELAVHQCAQLA